MNPPKKMWNSSMWDKELCKQSSLNSLPKLKGASPSEIIEYGRELNKWMDYQCDYWEVDRKLDKLQLAAGLRVYESLPAPTARGGNGSFSRR